MHISAAWRMVRKYATQIGLEDGPACIVSEIRGDRAHQARGYPGRQVVLGHRRIETTARFYCLDDELAGGLTDHLY